MEEMTNLIAVPELGLFFDIPTGLTCPMNADHTPDLSEGARVHVDDAEDREAILEAVEEELERRIAH